MCASVCAMTKTGTPGATSEHVRVYQHKCKRGFGEHSQPSCADIFNSVQHEILQFQTKRIVKPEVAVKVVTFSIKKAKTKQYRMKVWIIEPVGKRALSHSQLHVSMKVNSDTAQLGKKRCDRCPTVAPAALQLTYRTNCCTKRKIPPPDYISVPLPVTFCTIDYN